MKKTYIIAEAGVNHNGNPDLAVKLCDAAKKAGADAVKFQTFVTERSITEWSEKADYQKQSTASDRSQFDMIKKLELSFDSFRTIKEHCESIGIDFLSTPDDAESLNFLVSLGLDTLKIGSCEVTNIPYLRKVGCTGANIILSTGMSDMNEVQTAYDTLVDSGADTVALLHCTSDYPCRIDEVNLRAMVKLYEIFRTEVGYSDHTPGIEVAPVAVAFGATIIEKHLTLDKTMEGPDHSASLDPEEFSRMVTSIQNIEQALGDGVKRPTPSEIKNIPVVRRSLVAAGEISKGEVFSQENITAKRPGTGVCPSKWDEVMGKKAKRDFKKDELIEL